MHLVVISHKYCWQADSGQWFSSGGFPLQMRALAAYFNQVILAVPVGTPLTGGVPLPGYAQILPLRIPHGRNTTRKLDILLHAGAYLGQIFSAIAKADIVHTPAPGDMALLGLICARIQRKRIFVRYGGSWEINRRNSTANNFTRLLMRKIARSQVVMVSGYGLTRPAEDIQWLFSSTITQADVEKINPRVGGLNTPARLVYIGRLSEEKGVDVLLKSIQIVAQKSNGRLGQVLLIGDGPERGKLERLADELGLQEQIQFLGHLNHAEMTAWLLQADFCVHASHTEGFCKAWLDAFLHGLPVITTQVGAAAQVVGEHGERGWLVPAGDTELFAEKILEVLTLDLDWNQLRKDCRSFAEGMTLERWGATIADAFCQRWGLRIEDGRLAE
jgi:glycosyltransferase involved in cell wall biosynthesis